MNDRYLFRGRRIDNGKWVIGHLQEYENGGAAIKEPLALWPNALYQSIDPATVGQCTGVSAAKSYRGKEPEDLLIFEGDVLRVPIEHYGPDHPVRIVEWSGGGYRIRGVGSETGFCALTPMVNTAEIVGTIHDDNPELLEGSV